MRLHNLRTNMGGWIGRNSYSRGSIFPLATCRWRAFSGPPSAIFAWRVFRCSTASFIALAFSLNSREEVSTLLRIVETCSAWNEWVWFATPRRL